MLAHHKWKEAASLQPLDYLARPAGIEPTTPWFVDISLAVARGINWFGRKVRRGTVVYLAIEGHQRNRLAAYVAHHQLAPPPSDFHLIDVPLNLRDRLAMPTDAQQLTAAIRAQLRDQRVALVVIDTLNQALQGGDENSSEAMGGFIANANEIRAALGCAVVIVHHAGKDRAQGARGHSSLKGAVDTEIEVTYEKGTGIRIASVTKQRNERDDLEISFTLQSVDLGADPDDPNEQITSCVVVPVPLNAAAPTHGTALPTGRNQRNAWQKFRDDDVTCFSHIRGGGLDLVQW